MLTAFSIANKLRQALLHRDSPSGRRSTRRWNRRTNFWAFRFTPRAFAAPDSIKTAALIKGTRGILTNFDTDSICKITGNEFDATLDQAKTTFAELTQGQIPTAQFDIRLEALNRTLQDSSRQLLSAEAVTSPGQHVAINKIVKHRELALTELKSIHQDQLKAIEALDEDQLFDDQDLFEIEAPESGADIKAKLTAELTAQQTEQVNSINEQHQEWARQVQDDQAIEAAMSRAWLVTNMLPDDEAARLLSETEAELQVGVKPTAELDPTDARKWVGKRSGVEIVLFKDEDGKINAKTTISQDDLPRVKGQKMDEFLEASRAMGADKVWYESTSKNKDDCIMEQRMFYQRARAAGFKHDQIEVRGPHPYDPSSDPKMQDAINKIEDKSKKKFREREDEQSSPEAREALDKKVEENADSQKAFWNQHMPLNQRAAEADAAAEATSTPTHAA